MTFAGNVGMRMIDRQYVRYVHKLTTLEGGPKKVLYDFYISGAGPECELRNLNGAPESALSLIISGTVKLQFVSADLKLVPMFTDGVQRTYENGICLLADQYINKGRSRIGDLILHCSGDYSDPAPRPECFYDPNNK